MVRVRSGRRNTCVGNRLGDLLRVALILTLSIGVLTMSTNVAGAASSFSLSVDYGAGSAVAPGGKVDLVAQMPVAQAGTVNQEIVQSIDPTKLKLTGPSDITAPSGWSLSYSFDGTSWTTTEPTTVTGSATSWDKVVKVRAAGPIVSQGESNGFQIAEGSASGNPATVTSASVTSVSIGDPHYTFFNASRTLAFFVAHHRLGNILGCTVIATNTTCNGFPMDPGVTSDSWAVGKVINGRVWFPGSDGLACVDIRAVEQSPTTATPQGCGVYPSVQAPRTNLTGGWASVGEQQIWYIDDASGSFACFDTGTRQSCGRIRTALAPNISPSNQRFYKQGDYLYGANGANWKQLVCHRVSTGAPCPGFPKIGVDYGMMPVSVPDASGNVVAVCWGSSQCYDFNGTAYTPPSNFVSNVINVAADVATTVGTRVYTSNRIASGAGPKVVCWDVAKNSGAGGPCYGAANSYALVNYTVTPDPLLDSCLWISNDQAPFVKTYDMATNTNGCGSASLRVLTLAGTTAVPRMACAPTDGTSVIRAWRQLDLTTPSPSNYTSVTLSVGSSSGGVISGWQNRPVTSWPVDLAGLDPAATGSSPQFTLKFTGLSASVTSASVSVTAVGDSPALCLTPQSTLVCPAIGTGLGYVAGIPTATTTTVSSTGRALDANNNATSMGPASQTVNLGAPGPADCGGQVRGTTAMAGAGTKVAGITVNLLDSAGVAVKDANNNPITVTTDANGDYSFANLKPGSYKVSFGANGGTAANATLYADTGAGSVGSNTTTATSNVIAVVATQTDVVNATYPIPLTPAPDTTSGAKGAVQTIDLTLNDLPATGKTLTKSSVYLCDDGQTDAACKTAAVRTKTTAGVGTYSVNATTGVMTFTPLATYTGTPPPLKYVISDSAGNLASSTYTPTVIPPPAATADSSTGAKGAAQTIAPLSNDSAATGATLVASSVKLCGATDTAPSCTATSVAVSGQGTYTVDATTGAITFTPLASFTGTATPVTYSVTDSVGQKASTTYTPRVVPPPTATADFTTGPQGVAQSVDPSANDSAATGATLVASSVKLCGASDTAPNCTATSVSVSGQGTYTVDQSTGRITFTPLPSFTGPATPVTYSITDSLGSKASSTYSPSFIPASVAVPDDSRGAQGATQTVNPLTNDVPGSGATLTASSVRLCGASDTAPNCTATSVSIVGQGTYDVDASTGRVSFVPLASFTGTATSVTYGVTDSNGQRTSSTYTPTVIGAPAAAPDASTGAKGAAQTVDPLVNDVAGAGGTLDATSVKLCASGETAPACTASSVTISGQGTYSVDGSTGRITFTPVADFTGVATPVSYIVADGVGQRASSTYTPTVVAPPSLVADASTGAKGAAQTVDPVANDIAGTGGTLDATSVRLCASGETAPACTASSVTISGQGTYSVDGSTGRITFTPVADFTGVATPVSYIVADGVGQRASSTYTPTVVAPPTATPDASSGLLGVVQTTNPLSNDAAGTGAALDATSVRLCASGATAPACTASSVTITGQGTYGVDAVSGVISFTPEPSFAGVATPVTYSVTDSIAQRTSSTYTPTVIASPTAVVDTSEGGQGVAQTIDPLANDTAATGATLVASSVRLCDGADISPNCTHTNRVVAGQGTFSVDPSTGRITFTPDAGYVGTAGPVTYSVTDTAGQVASTTYVPTVRAVPSAQSDTSIGGAGRAQVIPVLANDYPSLSSSFVNASLKVCDGTDVAPNCTHPSRTIAGQGTYVVNGDGTVTFTPLAGFTSTATAATYSVTDLAGATVTASVTPTVVPTPTASADTSTGVQGAEQSVSPSTNDSAGSGATLVATSVRLCDGADIAPNCTHTSRAIVGQGTYSVETTTGQITFTPEATFAGVAAPVTYSITDSLGQTSSTTYTPTVIAAPTAVADTSSDAQGRPQTIDPLTNDRAASGFTLVASSVRLCHDPADAPHCDDLSLSIPGQGTYSVTPVTGQITFAPEANFVGVATPITYGVLDSVGQATSSTYTPTVVAPPNLTADASTGLKGAAQTVDPLANDTAGTGATIIATSVRLCGASDIAPACTATITVVAGQGTYTVDAVTGAITFTPDVSFVGNATPIIYSVTDSVGQTSSATYTPTVLANPTATPDTTLGAQGLPQSVNPLTNDTAAPGATLSVTSVKLCAAGETAPACTASSVTITGQGTYTVNATTGVVTFTPEPAFVGTATSVTYSVTDSAGQRASSTYTPTVVVVPSAQPDTSTGPVGVAQTIAVLSNDFPSLSSTFDPTTVKLCDGTDVAPNCTHATLTVAGQGTYEVEPSTGEILFTPAPGFVGTAAPVRYSVTDLASVLLSTTVTPTVVPSPVASPDASSAPRGVAQTVDPLANDGAGTGNALVPTTVRLCGPGEAPPICTATSLVIADEGTYSVNATTGQITFVPHAGFTGVATAVTYVVADSIGQVASSTYTPTVVAPPTLGIDTTIGVVGAAQSVNPLGNDRAGVGASLVATSVKLCTGTDVAPNCTHTTLDVAGQGRYTVDAVTGAITFTSAQGFKGVATAITYSVTDSFGQTSSTTYTPTVVDPPSSVPLASIGPSGQPQVIDPISGASPSAGASVDRSTVRLCAFGDLPPHCTAATLTVDGQGVWSVDLATGMITFTPAPGFVGTTASIRYSVSDTNGLNASSTAIATVTSVDPPGGDPTDDPPGDPTAPVDSTAAIAPTGAGWLPFTGSPTIALILGGAALFTVGTATVLLGSRAGRR